MKRLRKKTSIKCKKHGLEIKEWLVETGKKKVVTYACESCLNDDFTCFPGQDLVTELRKQGFKIKENYHEIITQKTLKE